MAGTRTRATSANGTHRVSLFRRATVAVGRRPSESFIPIASARKGRAQKDDAVQVAFDFDITGERRGRPRHDARRHFETQPFRSVM